MVMCTRAAAGWKLMVNPGGPSWLIVGIVWEGSIVRGAGFGLSVMLMAGFSSFNFIECTDTLTFGLAYRDSNMNWRNMGFGGYRVSVSIIFWGFDTKEFKNQ